MKTKSTKKFFQLRVYKEEILRKSTKDFLFTYSKINRSYLLDIAEKFVSKNIEYYKTELKNF